MIPYEKHFLPPENLVSGAYRVVDVGANEGYSSRVMADLWPDTSVLAIEMNSAVAAKAVELAKPYGDRMSVICAAVGWPPRQATAHVHSASTHTTLLGTGGEEKKVRVESLDSVIEAHFGHELIDYLVMDIEGAEVQVLEGECVWAYRTRVVAVECHGINEAPGRTPSASLHESGIGCAVERQLRLLGFEIVEGSWPFMVTGVRS